MTAIYELRRSLLRRHGLEAYRRLLLGHIWPGLEACGARPLCLLSALVGGPPEETYLIVGYRDAAEWERLQWAGPTLLAGTASPWADLEPKLAERRGLVLEESVHLMRPVEGRPKEPVPLVDRRDVYGLRRFLMRSEDWPEFVRSSWTLWGSWEDRLDSPILGMFRGAVVTDPLPVTLLTGYRSPSHWEQTRDLFKGGAAERPADMSPADWSKLLADYRIRNVDLPLTAYVCLMKAHWPAPR